MTRQGRGSSSRSKSINSTPEAFREKTLKLTPPGRMVAPRGKLFAVLSTLLAATSFAVRARRTVLMNSIPTQLLFRSGDHTVGLKAELPLQLLERRRGSESVHSDHMAGGANISLPSKCGGLLYRDARLDAGGQHAVTIRAGLLVEDVPGRHRHHARADALGA